MKNKRKGSVYLFLCVSLCICVLGCGSGSKGDAPSETAGLPKDLAGTWQGTLAVQGTELPLVFHFSLDNGTCTGSMDSPSQGAYGIPMNDITGTAEGFTASFIGGSAKLKGTFAGLPEAMDAEWIQGGGAFPLKLTRAAASGRPARPQEPAEPFPYREEEVTFENPEAGITLAGTLTIPEGNGPFPAVLLVSGSGQQNRDEEVFGHKPFLVLSDYLTRRGFAVLRYDDRGAGDSEGAEGLEAATTADFVEDAAAALSFLRGRAEVRPDRVGIIGHSEGGIIGTAMAAEADGPDFLVLMAGPALRGYETLLRQSEAVMRSSGAPEEDIAAVRALNEEVYRAVLEESDEASASRRIRELLEDTPMGEETVEAQMNSLLSSWFRYFLAHDPAEDLKRISVPVLALFGEKDVQVVADYEAPVMKELLQNNNRAEVQVLPGLNHLFQEADTGSVEEYAQIEQTLSPVFLDRLQVWLEGIAAGR